MILVERLALGPDDRIMRDVVLGYLRAANHIVEFASLITLAQYLDSGLDELVRAGYPRGLRRVMLFVRAGSLEAIRHVASLLLPGASMSVYQQPAVWRTLYARRTVLRRSANRLEPGAHV